MELSEIVGSLIEQVQQVVVLCQAMEAKISKLESTTLILEEECESLAGRLYHLEMNQSIRF